jgi:hypothetical protein
MAHNTRIRADLAAWALGSVLTPAEIDAIDAGIFKSLNGDEGGLWVPSGKIQLFGQSTGAFALEVQGGAPFRAYGPSGYIASMQAQNWPMRAGVASTATVNTEVLLTWSSSMGIGGGSRWCALTSAGAFDVFTSEDGTIWTAQTSYFGTLGTPVRDLAAGLVSGTPCLIATSTSGGGLMKSSDGGASWTVSGIASSGVTNAVITYSAPLNLWIAAGDGGDVATSPDCVTWTAQTTPAGWDSACGGAKRIVAHPTTNTIVILPLAGYGKFLVSTNGGTTWVERSAAAQLWTGLVYNSIDLRWMATSAAGACWISADGVTWTNTGTSTLPASTCLATYQSVYISTSVNGVFGGIAWSADRGVTWQRLAVGSFAIAGEWRRVIAADNRFLVTKATGSALDFAFSLRAS